MQLEIEAHLFTASLKHCNALRHDSIVLRLVDTLVKFGAKGELSEAERLLEGCQGSLDEGDVGEGAKVSVFDVWLPGAAGYRKDSGQALRCGHADVGVESDEKWGCLIRFMLFTILWVQM